MTQPGHLAANIVSDEINDCLALVSIWYRSRVELLDEWQIQRRYKWFAADLFVFARDLQETIEKQNMNNSLRTTTANIQLTLFVKGNYKQEKPKETKTYKTGKL